MLENLSPEGEAIKQNILALLTSEGEGKYHRLLDKVVEDVDRTDIRRIIVWFAKRPRKVEVVRALYYVSIVMMVAAVLPQIARVARLRSAVAVSVIWAALSVIGFGLRIIYFLHIKSLPGFVFCTVMTALTIVLLALVIQYTYIEPSRADEDLETRCGN